MIETGVGNFSLSLLVPPSKQTTNRDGSGDGAEMACEIRAQERDT